MPLAPEAAIPDALLEHLGEFAAAQSPALGVFYPGLPFSPTDGVAYLAARYMPNRNDVLAVSDAAHERHFGLLQVSVMWPDGEGGIIPAMDLAGQVIAHFPKGTRLQGDGVKVEITRQAWLVQPLEEDDGRLMVPVTIPYQAFVAPAVSP